MRQYSKVDITVMQLIGIMPTYAYDLNKTLGEVLVTCTPENVQGFLEQIQANRVWA
jgi:hypothetical protein